MTDWHGRFMKTALTKLLAGSALAAHVADLSSVDAGEQWLRLIPAGTFSGRDGRGPYHAGGKADLERIAEMTRRYNGETDIVIDYEHQTLEAKKNGQPAPAAGWVKEIEARDDGLYGRVEWTANAATRIEAKEYRYLSPVYYHAKDGKVLLLQHAALTNTPNLDHMQVSAHSAFFTPEQEAPMKTVLAALGLTEGASEGEALTAVQSLLSDRKAITAAAGLADDAAATAIVAAMSVNAGTPDPSKYVPIGLVTAMQADLTELRGTLDQDKAEKAVADAIREGRLTPAQKDWATAYHRADPAGFADFVSKAPVLSAAQRSSASAQPPAKVEGALDAHHSAIAAAMGVDPAAYAKTLAAEEAEREDA